MTDLLDHKKVVHEGNKIVCTYNGCNETFVNQNAMKKHLIQHTKEKMKMCDQCCKMFHHDSDVKLHMESHMDPEYECEKCQEKYRYKSQLMQHLKVCGTKRRCQYKKMFKEPHYLKNLISTKHALPENWKFQCNICDTKPKFQYRDSLQRHNRKEHTENSF